MAFDPSTASLHVDDKAPSSETTSKGFDPNSAQLFNSEKPPEPDGPLTRGFKKAGQSMKMTAQLAGGDTEGVAQTAQEAADYAQANPGRPEGQKLMDAWEKGDGVTGGIVNVARQIKSDYDGTRGFLPGLRAVGRDLRAMGEGVVEQVPNMIAPTVGLVGGAAAGSAAAGPVGAIAGGWAGASAGNALVEGGDQIQTALQQAGIDPRDTQTVQAYVDANRDQLLKQTAIKGGVIGAVDTATGGLAHYLLTAPGKAAAGRALSAMGVDMADKAAVKAATQSGEFAQQIAGDAAYQASKKGAGNVARNATAAALEPAGEFVGEYVGQGLANDQWDTKNAALEALSSIGQSGAMFAGQKVWQYATNPAQAAKGSEADAGATPGQPADAGLAQEGLQQTGADAGLGGADQAAIAATPDAFSPGAETPHPAGEVEPPHRAMGIDPNAGPLSAGAAIAVDSGAAGQMQAAAVQPSAEQGGDALATWDTLKPGDNVTLYRGESEANDANGQWWTTDRKKAERYGAVTEVTLPAEVAGRHAARGHNGADEFVFPNERPAELAGARAAAQEVDNLLGKSTENTQEPTAGKGFDGSTTVAPAAQQEQSAGSLVQAAQAENTRPAAGPRSGGRAPGGGSGGAGQSWADMSVSQRESLARSIGLPPIFQKNVSRARWEGLNPDLQARIAKAMAPAASSIEGADLGNGWAAFSPESGTAGVPRAEMPQIKAEHRGAMVNFMNARGIAHQEETLPASSLKPTQAEFSREKVSRAKGFEGGIRAILVSADNHVLDGHHQWMAARERGEDVRAIRLNAPIRNLIGLAHDFPSSTKASGAAGPAESTGASGQAADPAKIKPKSLVQLVRDAGGVSLDRKADIDQGSRTVGVFRRGGMDLDGLAELMQQHGFLTDADVTDTTSGAERAAELLRAALAGERVLSLNDVDAAMSQDAEAQYRDGIRQRAADYGIRTMFRPFGDIERDVLARDGDLAPEDRSVFEYNGDVAYALEPLDDIDLQDARTLSEEEQMRMAGFSEDEINETINGTGIRESQGAPEQSQPGAAQESRNAGAQENQSQEGSPEGLTGYTNEGIARQEAAQRAAAAEAERTQREADQKAQADAERGSFTLTGSDRAADVQAAQGQGGLFDAPADAKPTSMKDGLTKIRKEKAAQAASESNQESIKNEFRANAGLAAELAPGDQEPIKKNPSDPATPSEDALIATGLLRDRGDVWQYKFNVDGRWMTANVKSDAVDRATTTYLSAPESERITTKQRADRADAELIKRMDQTYGRMSISELEAQHDRLGGSISDLQRAGAREFNGNGRRRTSAAVSNEAARGAGEDRLHLGIYIKHRRDLIGQEAINTVEDLTDTGQPAVGNAPSPLEALFSDLNSESTRKANKAKKAAAKLPQAARIDYVQANFHDILMQMMDAGALEVNGAATLTEDNKSCL